MTDITIYAETRIGGAVAYSPDVWGVFKAGTPEQAAKDLANSYQRHNLVAHGRTIHGKNGLNDLYEFTAKC